MFGNSHKAATKTKMKKCTRSLQLIAVILTSIKLSLLQATKAHALQDINEGSSSSSSNSSQQQMPLAVVANQSSAGASGGQNATQLGMVEQNPDASDTVPVYMQHTTTVLVTLHLSVFVSGLVGNSLVCLSVYRNKSLQTITNYYIVNLAVADFLVILICLPPTVYWDLTLTWDFGLVLCKLVPYLQSISVSVSVLTLTCISIDRWYAICRPLKFCSTKSRAKATIGLIWIVSALIASPDVIFLTTRPVFEENGYVYMDCTHSWPESNTKIYQLCIVTLLFVLPFVLMIISYSQIVNVLWRNETMAESMQNSFDASSKIKAAQEAELARAEAECRERQRRQNEESKREEGRDDCKSGTGLTSGQKGHLALKFANNNKLDAPPNRDHSRAARSGGEIKKRLLNLSAAAGEVLHFFARHDASKHESAPINSTCSKGAASAESNLIRAKKSSKKIGWQKQLTSARCCSLILPAARYVDDSSTIETSHSDEKTNCVRPNGVSGDNLHREHVSQSSSAIVPIAETISSTRADKCVSRKMDEDVTDGQQQRLKQGPECCAPLLLSQSLDNRNEVIVSRDKAQQQLATGRLSLPDRQTAALGAGQLRRRHNKPHRRCPHRPPETEAFSWNDERATSFKGPANNKGLNLARGACLQQDDCSASAAAAVSISNTMTSTETKGDKQEAASSKLHLLLAPQRRHKNHCSHRRHRHQKCHRHNHHHHQHRHEQQCCNQDQNERHYRGHGCHCSKHKQRHHHQHCCPAASKTFTRRTERLSDDNNASRPSRISNNYLSDTVLSANNGTGSGNCPDNSLVGVGGISTGGSGGARDERAGELAIDRVALAADEQPALNHHHHLNQCGAATGGGSPCTLTILMLARDQVNDNEEKEAGEEDTVDDARRRHQAADSGTKKLQGDEMACSNNTKAVLSSPKVAGSELGASAPRSRQQQADLRSGIGPTGQAAQPEGLAERCIVHGKRGLLLGRLVAIKVLQKRLVPERPSIGANSSSNLSVDNRTSRPTGRPKRLASSNSLATPDGTDIDGVANKNNNNNNDNNNNSGDNQVFAVPSSSSEPSLLAEGADNKDEAGRREELSWASCVSEQMSVRASVSSGQLTQSSCCDLQCKPKLNLKTVSRQASRKSVASLTAILPCDRPTQGGQRNGSDIRSCKPLDDSTSLPISCANHCIMELGTGKSGQGLAHRDSNAIVNNSVADNSGSHEDEDNGDDKEDEDDDDDDDDAIATVAVHIKAKTGAVQVRARNGKLRKPVAAGAEASRLHSRKSDVWRLFASGSPTTTPSSVNRSSSSTNNNNKRFCKLIESRKKAAKMLIVIVIMFGLCYLPVHFLNTLRVTIGLPQNDITTIASLVSHWLCYFNSAVNPLIYNLMSGKFRHEFANLFFCRCFRRSTANGPTAATTAPTIVVLPSTNTQS